MAKRAKAIKEFNAGTMTKSAFFGMIRSCLRQKSRWWKPITQCKNAARRSYKGENKRRKWEYICSSCKQWLDAKQITVDHIIPCGTLADFNDLPQFVKTLFCEEENLQCLCKTCHDKKTKKDNNARSIGNKTTKGRQKRGK